MSVTSRVLYNSFISGRFAVLLLFLLVSCNRSGFRLLDDSTVTIPTENGWVLINFWASWCQPCLEEIPEINKISEQLPTPIVAVYGIYFDPVTKEQLQQAVKNHKVKFDNFSPEQADYPVPIPSMLPANYLINPQGEIIGPLLGPQTKQSILQAISSNLSKNH